MRSFTDEDISDETVGKLLELATRAPNAGNLQPWRFYVVRKKNTKHLLCESALGQRFLEEAPVVIVVCADLDVSGHGYGSRGESLYSIQDTAAAIENILLCVVALDLGACWVGAFREDLASNALNLPGRIRPLALIPIGHPAEKPRRTHREPFEKYTKYV